MTFDLGVLSGYWPELVQGLGARSGSVRLARSCRAYSACC